MSVDLMNIGMSSLVAYKNALSVTSDNIANANTPEYARRAIDFSENIFGFGVKVADVRRVVDEEANQYARTSNSNFTGMQNYLKNLQQFEPLFENDSTNINKFITDTQVALQDTIRDPSVNQNRATYLAKLSVLVQQFQNTNNEIVRQKRNVNDSLETTVTAINSILSSIADINKDVATQLSRDPTVLADETDTLLQKLSNYLNFTSQKNNLGQTNIILSNGAALINAETVSTFSLMPDPENSSNELVGLNSGGGTIDVTNVISGGAISGLVSFKEDVMRAERALGRISLSFSQTLNSQNRLGIDGNGMLGGDIFQDINIASLMSQRVISNVNNTGVGDMSVHIDAVGELTTSDYTLTIQPSNKYVLTRKTDGVQVANGTLSSTFPQNISADGLTISVNSGTYNSGDQYTISPTAGAIDAMQVTILNDPSKLALAWPVVASPNLNNTAAGTINVDSITDPTKSSFSTPGQLSPPITIQFTSATTYNIVNATTGVPIESGITYNPSQGANIFPTPGSYDPGYRVSLSGTIGATDSFSIGFNSKSLSDNRNGLVIARLYTQGILENGKLNFKQGYDTLTQEIANKVSSVNQGYKDALDIKSNADQRREQISGVSIEEETMNLSQYQQAYQASAQILQSAKTIFDAILQMTRR